MTKISPSFGSNIRAARLGFHWSYRHGAFIRMSTIGDRTFIELAPANAIPNGGVTKDYRCWWEGGDGVLDMIPWLRNVRRVKKHIAVEVDDNGNIVAERVGKKGKVA